MPEKKDKDERINNAKQYLYFPEPMRFGLFCKEKRSR